MAKNKVAPFSGHGIELNLVARFQIVKKINFICVGDAVNRHGASR